MLEFMRASKGAAFIKFVLFSILIASFMVWGIADMLLTGGSQTVATVGGEDISLTTFQEAYQRRVSELARFGLSPEQMKAYVPQSVLQSLVQRRLLKLYAGTLGLVTSDQNVLHAIYADPRFQDKKGTFQRARYEFALEQSGMSEKAFVEQLKKNLLVQQALSWMTPVPPGSWVERQFLWNHETRDVQYVRFTLSDAKITLPAPTKEELKGFYTAHKELFKTPEHRTVDYALLSPKDLKVTLSVSDSALKSAYTKRLDQYSTPEKRALLHMNFSDKASAEKAEVALKKNEDFMKVASSLGMSKEVVDLGLVAQKEVPDQKLASTAFSLSSGQVSGLVKGAFGWSIVKVAKIVPARRQTFQEARAALKSSLLEERAENMVADLSNTLDDALASGASLKEAAQKVGVVSHTSPPLTRGDTNKALPPVLRTPAVLASVFSALQGQASPSLDVGQGSYFFFTVAKVNRSHVQDFKGVRDKVVTLWGTQKRKELLGAKAKSLSQGSLESASQTLASKVASLQKVTRLGGSSGKVLPKELLKKIFQLPKGGATPFADGTHGYLVRVQDVHAPQKEAMKAAYDKEKEAFARTLSQGVSQELLAVLRDRYSVKVHGDVFERVVGDL